MSQTASPDVLFHNAAQSSGTGSDDMFRTLCRGQPAWLAIGVGVGTALGVAFDHLAVGVALGVAIGTLLQGANRPKA